MLSYDLIIISTFSENKPLGPFKVDFSVSLSIVLKGGCFGTS